MPHPLIWPILIRQFCEMKSPALLIGLTAALVAVLYSRSAKASQESRMSGLISVGEPAFPVVVENVSTPYVDQGTLYVPPAVSEWDNNSIVIGDIMSYIGPSFISDAGIELLKQREGYSDTPYADHKGQSIFYGHLIKPGETVESLQAKGADAVFLDDIEWANTAVIEHVIAPITQNQFDALVSFCYNVGSSAFAGSTLVKKINSNDPTAVDEFSRWVNASGVRNDALVTRRMSEAEQFASA